jgi:choline dehydrogenase
VQGYDYIVAGGGTAGCVLAARLSQDPAARVLLLEAGSADRTRAMIVPAAWPENLGAAADWADLTTSQVEAGPVPYPHGRALGGSGAINAMAHVRGHRAGYDGWAADGADGWDFASLLPCFRRTERAAGRDPALRGTDGPLPVGPADPAGRHPVAEAFAAALTDLGCPVTDDLSGPRQEGVAWVDLAISGGERVSPADAYLRPVLHRPNLVVETGCLVTGLWLRGGRCTGVSYLRAGQPAGAAASSEVILCAGAIGSAQLLLLSGIGPAGQLRALGIDPVADLPGVGANLQDHPIILLSYAARVPLPASRYNHGEVYAALRSQLARGNGLAGSGGSAGSSGLARSSGPDRHSGPATGSGPDRHSGPAGSSGPARGSGPDLHLFPILLPLAPAGCAPPDAGYALVAAVTQPASRGSVRLAGPAPQTRPLIDPGLLADDRDLDRLEEGLRLVRQAAAQPGLAKLAQAEVWPGPDVRDRAGLRGYIRRGVGSYWHPAGTCRIGRDAAAVVDPELRVHGLAGLRVADASVMPTIPNAHPNATVLAIAERAADLIQPGDLAGRARS